MKTRIRKRHLLSFVMALAIPAYAANPPIGLTATFITPAGDPVGAPKDAGDGQNEFTFNAAKLGVLTVNLKATINIQGQLSQALKDKLKFTIDGIGNSQMKWDPLNAGGKPTFNGNEATAKITFTNLPAKNTDFGKKNTSLLCDGQEIAKEDFEVFFIRDVKNHPDGQGNVWDNVNLKTQKGDVPNWYYYWGQLGNVQGHNIAYGAAHTDAATPGITEWSYDKVVDKTLIVVGDKGALNAAKAYGVGQFKSGIDYYTDTVLHESKHVVQISRADGLLVSNGTDSFRYGWSWNKAIHNHWTKGADKQWGVANQDDEKDTVVDNAKIKPPFEPGNGDDVSLDHPQFLWWPNAWPLPNPNNAFHPVESEAVNFADNNHKEHQNARSDWGNPGKNHKTINKWDN